VIKKILFTLVAFFISSVGYAASDNKSLLIVITGASELKLKAGEIYKTGYWLEEFSVPYALFEEAGYQLTVATPKGNRPTVDHASVSVGENGKPLYWNTVEELNEALSIKKRVLDEGKILSLSKLSEKELSQFDAVFFPGGHGPMNDMLNNSDVARVLRHFHDSSKPTALVCHAPAVLVSTRGNNFPYHGYRVTAFTDLEESQTPVGPKMLTTPQKELVKAGAVFVEQAPWQSHIVEDRELITGQNPASSKAIAEALIKRLAKQ